ncbi:type VII secretion target [Mycolicibacterium austroafricanum]|uniref:type VII secretion target n=1 Tax=Mycolicibacterium austroafricanum TaxID=39687 RepID=UPI001CA367D1|nr:type VII secretion target [Mycolicibacterium austroafricanum]QZT56298.1 hypothetical protein JN084_25815 [Mycolicibacterium austroafricanum]
MLVDPELLRAFAAQVDAAAATIRGTDVGTTAGAAGDGLPGSDTQWSARQVGGHISLVASDIAGDIAEMGRAVRGAGDSYEVTDESLAGSFTGLF